MYVSRANVEFKLLGFTAVVPVSRQDEATIIDLAVITPQNTRKYPDFFPLVEEALT